MNGQLVAEAEIGLVNDLNDFVFYEPTNLLYLVDAMERITARELTFVVENFDRGGVFAKTNTAGLQGTTDQIAAILAAFGDATHSTFFVSYGMQHSQLLSIFSSLGAFDQLGVFVNEFNQFIDAFAGLFSDLSTWVSTTTDSLAQDAPGLYYSIKVFASIGEALPSPAHFDFITIGQSYYTHWADTVEDGWELAETKSSWQKWHELLLTIHAELRAAGQNVLVDFDFENNLIIIEGVVYPASNEAIQQFLLLHADEQNDMRPHDFILRPVRNGEAGIVEQGEPLQTSPSSEPKTR